MESSPERMASARSTRVASEPAASSAFVSAPPQPGTTLVVLHDDKDFATAARWLPGMRERTIHDAPQPG